MLFLCVVVVVAAAVMVVVVVVVVVIYIFILLLLLLLLHYYCCTALLLLAAAAAAIAAAAVAAAAAAAAAVTILACDSQTLPISPLVSGVASCLPREHVLTDHACGGKGDLHQHRTHQQACPPPRALGASEAGPGAPAIGSNALSALPMSKTARPEGAADHQGEGQGQGQGRGQDQSSVYFYDS